MFSADNQWNRQWINMHTLMDTHLNIGIDDDWTQKAQMLTLATAVTDHQKNKEKNENNKKTLQVTKESKLVE